MCSAINLGSDYSPSLSLHFTLKLSPRKTAGRVPSLPSLATLPGPQWSRAACYKGRLVQKTCAFTLWSQMSSSSFPTKNYSEISKCLGFLLIVWKNSFLYISAMWHFPPPRGGGSHVWISHLWWSNYLLPQYFQRSHLTYFPSCILFYHRFSNLFLKPLWPHSLSLSTVC